MDIVQLRAVEKYDKSGWTLEGSELKMKNIWTNCGFQTIAKFTTLDECKAYCDEYFPGIEFTPLTFHERWSNFM